MKKLQTQNQMRELQQTNNSIDTENLTVRISFASENPVLREINGNFYREILLCGIENVNLERLNTGGAVLYNHDKNYLIGAVIDASVDQDRVCRANVKFSSVGLARDKFTQVQEQILTKISVGYNIDDYEIRGDELLITRWTPTEVSFVSVPADNNVGVGRTDELEFELPEEEIITESENEERDEVLVEEEVKELEEEVVITELEEVKELNDEEVIIDSEVDDDEKHKDENDKYNHEEDKRKRELSAIANVLNISDNKLKTAIENGISVQEFKRQIATQNEKTIVKENKIMKNTILGSLIRAVSTGSLYGANAPVRSGEGYNFNLTRDNTTTVNGAGVITEVVSPFYIDQLFAESILGRLGVTTYTGLAGRGELVLPKLTAVDAPSFKQIGEGLAIGDSASNWTSLKLSPKKWGMGIPVTRELSLSSETAERFVADALMNRMRDGIEQAIMKDVQGQAQVQAVAAAGEISMSDIQAAILLLSNKNVHISDCYAVVSPKTAAVLRQTPILGNVAGRSFIEGAREEDRFLADEMRIVVSTFVEDGSVLIGDFSKVVLAIWQDAFLDIDDTTLRAAQTTIFRSVVFMDLTVSHPEAFVNLKL
ncbi:HK97 family phage prohead protease [Yersinia enterocolitica]